MPLGVERRVERRVRVRSVVWAVRWRSLRRMRRSFWRFEGCGWGGRVGLSGGVVGRLEGSEGIVVVLGWESSIEGGARVNRKAFAEASYVKPSYRRFMVMVLRTRKSLRF